MKKPGVLNVYVVTTDLSLCILSAPNKNYVSKSLFNLLDSDSELKERIQKMRLRTVGQFETMSTIDGQKKRYSLVVRRGKTKYIVVFIELEYVYQLLENVALYRKYAFTDDLTGALTRHGYWNELFVLLNQAQKHNASVGVIFADIDNLKRINTEKGYQIGDKTITQISTTIASVLRMRDLLVRLGGDEFLIIMELGQNGRQQLEKIAKRIVTKINKEKSLLTTASLGTQVISARKVKSILSAKNVKIAWESCVVKTDIKLRKAKRLGRNRVV